MCDRQIYLEVLMPSSGFGAFSVYYPSIVPLVSFCTIECSVILSWTLYRWTKTSWSPLITTRTVLGLGAKIIGPNFVTKLGLYVIMVPKLIQTASCINWQTVKLKLILRFLPQPIASHSSTATRQRTQLAFNWQCKSLSAATIIPSNIITTNTLGNLSGLQLSLTAFGNYRWSPSLPKVLVCYKEII